MSPLQRKKRKAYLNRLHAEEVQILKRLGTIRILLYYSGAITWNKTKESVAR